MLQIKKKVVLFGHVAFKKKVKMQISLTEDARRRTKPITIGHLSDSGERKTIHFFQRNWSGKGF